MTLTLQMDFIIETNTHEIFRRIVIFIMRSFYQAKQLRKYYF